MIKIRSHLALLAVSILLPVVIFAVIGLLILRDGERDAALRGLRETARATALTVDQGLSSAATALELLARSANLESGNLPEFYQQALLLNKGPTSWTILLDENAQQLINTARPFSEKLPPVFNSGRVQEVMATQKPLASDLLLGQVTKKLMTVLYVPVPAHGGKRYVLAQIFTVDFFNTAVFQSGLPKEWIVGITGRDGRFIARSHRAAELVGQTTRADVLAAVRAAPDGLLRHTMQDGSEVYDAFTHSAVSGWTIEVAAPVASIEATVGRAAALGAIGLLLAVAVAIAMATVLGRGLVQSISAAAQAATNLGHGVSPQLARSSVQEIDQLHAALSEASGLLARSQEARLKAESEREVLLQNESAARLRAEAENVSKDEFLAMLGHELRNPLAAISGAIALSERHGDAPAAAAEARAVIRRQSGHLTHLVDDLLDVSRMAGGKIQLTTRPLDLANKVSLCLESLRVSGRTAGYALKCSTEPVWVVGDPTRLEQIINNLLVNALKFTPLGGLIELTVSAGASEAVLTIKDSGVGMAPELLPHIFDAFVQGASSLDRAQGGLGIGLALVRQLVSLHGGTVSATSAGPGQGSTFTIRLPRIAAPAAAPAPAGPASPTERRWRILLIEDNDDARNMLRQLLDLEGHEVFEASSAIAGLLLASSRQPDLAVVDIGLPEMTGYEIAQRLRADPKTRTMGLIAMTGYGQQDDRDTALAAGFDFHLVKPVDVNQLLGVIDQCGQATLSRRVVLAA